MPLQQPRAHLWRVSDPADAGPIDDSVFEKLIRWGLFAVAVSTVPIFIAVVVTVTHGAESEDREVPSQFDLAMRSASGFEQALGRGDLFLVAASIAAGGVGELVARGTHQRKSFKLIAGGTSLLILVICSVWFANISSLIASGEAVDLGPVASGSIAMFVCSVVAAASCIATAER